MVFHDPGVHIPKPVGPYFGGPVFSSTDPEYDQRLKLIMLNWKA